MLQLAHITFSGQGQDTLTIITGNKYISKDFDIYSYGGTHLKVYKNCQSDATNFQTLKLA